MSDGAPLQPDAQKVQTQIKRLKDALRTKDSATKAAARGQDAHSASMSLRKLHDQFVGMARGQHCRGALYRSEEARKLVASPRGSEATIHCEHTIPVSIVVQSLWYFMRAGAEVTDQELLRRVLNFTVVTACSQLERKSKDGLAKRRLYDGHDKPRAWARHHPDLAADGQWGPEARPFLRYHRTSVRVFRGTTLIDLERYTLKMHQDWIADLPIYDASAYY